MLLTERKSSEFVEETLGHKIELYGAWDTGAVMEWAGCSDFEKQTPHHM